MQKEIDINFRIDGNELVIDYFPVKDITDGLRIEHGEVDPGKGVELQPAMTHDLYAGISRYPLPEGFDPSEIKKIQVIIQE